MKILYISYDGMTDQLGQSQVIPYLQGLSAAGHHVTLLSAEKPLAFENQKIAIQNLLDKSAIIWKPVSYTSKPPVVSTLLDLYKIRKAAFLEIQKNNIEVVHCRSYISALVGLAAKRKFGVKFLFDMRGFWADERIDGGIWDLKNPIFKSIYGFFKRKEKEFFTEADAVISLTENAKKEIHSWKGFSNINIKVIPCCADLNLYNREKISSEKLKQVKERLAIPDSAFVLSYLGSLGTWYMLDEMLLFFKRLLVTYPNAVFLFITKDEKSLVLERANSFEIDSSKLFISPASRSEVPLFSALSDVSLFFIKPLYSKKASSPTKMGELMALGIPLICNGNVGDVEDIINDNANGLVVNEFTNSEFDKVISNLPDLLAADKNRNVLCAERHYSLKEGVKKYLEVYQRLEKG